MKSNNKKESDKDILLQIINKIASLKDMTDESIGKIIVKNPSISSETFSKSQIISAFERYKTEIGLSLEERKRFLSLIKMKKIRTMSGVTPVAVLTKPYPCPGKCIYCPNDINMPKSYLSLEPGAQRALSNRFDPYLQVYNRLVAYKKIGHPTDKVELIVLGGTWSFYPKNYQRWFIKRSFDAMNDFNHISSENYLNDKNIVEEQKIGWKELEKAQKLNETAFARCVGLVLETRPDYITKEEVSDLRRLGATKVQIGVQSLDDKILKLNKRGHGIKTTKEAFRILRSAGFKIHAHWMPNLLGSNPEKDVEDFKKLFDDESYRPDELKIYPCSLIKDTELYNLYREGKWKPYSEEELLYVLEKCISYTPRYCRLTRIVRDISSQDIEAGNRKSNFRQIVEKSLEKKKVSINDIRYREIKDQKINGDDLELKITNYSTDVSDEYFLEYVTKEDKIAAFLRLSIPKTPSFIEEIKNSAVIREVHVYGSVVGIGEKGEDRVQHEGLGTKLMEKAEKISTGLGFKKISVISSIGTRQYYAKKGYELVEMYQVKTLN